MSIEKQEIEALEELEKLKQSPAEDKEKSEKLVDQVTQDVATEQDEPPAEQDEKEPDEADEQEDAPDEEEDPKEEEELTGAKFRHKLKAEKEEKEKAQREVQEMKERLARLEGVQSVRQQQQQPEPEKEDIPDEALEPERFAIWKASKLEKELQVVKAQQQKQAALHKWELMESEYSGRNKGYGGAKKFLLDGETKKIKQQYPTATDFQIREHLKEQEHALVGNLASAGVDPLQHIEFLAYQQGFRPKEQADTTANKKKKITNINKNSAKNTSVIGGSAAGDSARLTAEQMLDMSYEEITKFGRDKYEEEIRRLAR